MSYTPKELICTGKRRHRITLAWTTTPEPKKCPACGKDIEKYDGRKHARV